MASSMYDQLLSVLRHPPDCRLHFQLDHLLPWFKKKVSLFRSMKSETLNDLIKNARFITKDPDDIIIRQGDIGDCMYILLRGQVTVFIQYPKNEGDERPQNVPVPAANKSEMLRHQLGTFVTHIGPGVQFGEVALLSDQVRTASIVTDERSELIMIDRELYNRSVRDVLQHEFDVKVRFIEENQHFQKMAPRFRKQLAMALQNRTIPYEGILMRQGDPVDTIYFTLAGELKVTTDPNQHPAQFPKLLTDSSNSSLSIQHVKAEPAVEDLKKTNNRRDSMTHQQRKAPLEVCLIGINKSIGDVEMLMGMKTYMQTVSGTQTTELLQLEHKHYDRLFLRRNAAVVDGLLFDVELCLRTRTAALQARRERVPLFDALLTVVGRQTAVIRRRQQQQCGGSTSSVDDGDRRRGSYARQRNGSKVDAAMAMNGARRASAPVVHRTSSKLLSVVAQSSTSLPLSPNVDDHSSPYATQRTGRRVTLANVGGAESYDEQQQQQGRRLVVATHLPEQYVTDGGQVQVLTTSGIGDQQQTLLNSQRESQHFVIPCAGDFVADDGTNLQLNMQQSTAIEVCNSSVLEAENIENRLRSWLTDFGRDHPVARSSISSVGPSMDANRFDVVGPSSTIEPRITTLKRCQTPVEGVRPGAKAIFRSKHRDTMSEHEHIDAGELMKLNYGNGLNNTRLEYYKSALTADVPFTARDLPAEYD